MILVFLLALRLKNNSVVDIFWGLGFIVIAAFSFFYSGQPDLHKIILNLLVLTWGARLSVHVFLRNRGKGEDFRYKAWRDSWNHFILRSFFQIFMLQGFLMLVIAMPVYFVNLAPSVSVGPFDIAGLAVFLTGFFFESVGDCQLVRFKKDPGNKGKIITTGLWKITRHPNYFGEALIWLGISFFALGSRLGWITLISPVAITLLLRFVSGVPMLEKKYKGCPDWEEYKRRTAPFVPFVRFL
jgi:steroid 5-alpha reductase family enzyme